MTDAPSDLRERIVDAAARLLTAGGREAVSTRGVSAAAGVQAPAIYRQFGDMHGLLRAAARAVLARYVREKARGAPAMDPVDDLLRGWDLHIEFGLANPAAYALLYTDPGLSDVLEAREGLAHLTTLLTRVAEVGRLQVNVPLAVKMMHAAGSGVILTLIAAPPGTRDTRLSSLMRDAVLAAIVVGKKAEGADRHASAGKTMAARAVALRAVLDDADAVLSTGEKQVMGEWLDRMAEGRQRSTLASTVAASARSTRARGASGQGSSRSVSTRQKSGAAPSK